MIHVIGLTVNSVVQLEELTELYLDFAPVKSDMSKKQQLLVPINIENKFEVAEAIEWSVSLLIIEGLSCIVDAVSRQGNDAIR